MAKLLMSYNYCPGKTQPRILKPLTDTCNLARLRLTLILVLRIHMKKEQVGKDQEKAQSGKDSHSKNRGRSMLSQAIGSLAKASKYKSHLRVLDVFCST